MRRSTCDDVIEGYRGRPQSHGLESRLAILSSIKAALLVEKNRKPRITVAVRDAQMPAVCDENARIIRGNGYCVIADANKYLRPSGREIPVLRERPVARLRHRRLSRCYLLALIVAHSTRRRDREGKFRERIPSPRHLRVRGDFHVPRYCAAFRSISSFIRSCVRFIGPLGLISC